MKLLAAYSLFSRISSLLQSPFLLVIRLYWGWGFFVAGKGKLFHLDRTADFFRELNIPLPHLNALVAGSVECLGGLLLLLGLGSRLVSLPLAFTMIVAYATADSAALKGILSKPEDFTSAAPFLFLVTSLIILGFGPGKFSIDQILQKRFRGEP